MTHDAAWYEKQYNPRLSVPDTDAIISGWRTKSAMLRNRVPPQCDFKYGPHPRETLDVFHAPNAKATLVYIHGGYWHSFSKLETSFIAEDYVKRGISVVLVNYPLCPDVTVTDIRASVLAAFAYTWNRLLTAEERQTIVVSGHSAGGHLAALHAVAAQPDAKINAVVSLSGVFDLAPLLHTSMNASIRLNENTVGSLNLLHDKPQAGLPLLLAVGGDESEEFHRQSEALAQAWDMPAASVISLPGINHFTIVDEFAAAGTALHETVMAQFPR
jgi:arylformamidase